MNKYSLCLFYSWDLYQNLLEDEFDDFRDIDKITIAYQNEKEFINNKNIKEKISNIQNKNASYLSLLSNKSEKKGRIAIVKKVNNRVLFIKPLYKMDQSYQSTNKLTNSIIERLKSEEDIVLVSKFLSNFKTTFYTELNLYMGLNRLKNYLVYQAGSKISSRKEKDYFEKIIRIISATIQLPNNNDIDLDKLFLYRRMSTFLDSQIQNDRLIISYENITKLKKAILDKEKSLSISQKNSNKKLVYKK